MVRAIGWFPCAKDRNGVEGKGVGQVSLIPSVDLALERNIVHDYDTDYGSDLKIKGK